MEHSYKISKSEAIRLNSKTVEKAAMEHGYTIEESFSDWSNEGPIDEWLKTGVAKLLGIS